MGISFAFFQPYNYFPSVDFYAGPSRWPSLTDFFILKSYIMKRAKTLFTAFAAIVGIGGSIAASKEGSYCYTLTTGGEVYEYNISYSSGNCYLSSSDNYCEITTIYFDGAKNPTSAELISSVYQGVGYGPTESYAY
jgi:hypothetical protein